MSQNTEKLREHSVTDELVTDDRTIRTLKLINTRNSSRDEIANVNFLYDNNTILPVLDLRVGILLEEEEEEEEEEHRTRTCINSSKDRRGYVLELRTQVYQIQWNNAMQRPLRRSRSFKVTDCGTNRKLIRIPISATNYLLLSCTVSKLPYGRLLVKFPLASGKCLTLTLSLRWSPQSPANIVISDISLKLDSLAYISAGESILNHFYVIRPESYRIRWNYVSLRHRRRSGWTSGGTHGERRRWVGNEWGGVWGGMSPLQPTKGYRGASWTPPAGSGAEPRPKTDFGVFWRPQNQIKSNQINLFVTHNIHNSQNQVMKTFTLCITGSTQGA